MAKAAISSKALEGARLEVAATLSHPQTIMAINGDTIAIDYNQALAHTSRLPRLAAVSVNVRAFDEAEEKSELEPSDQGITLAPRRSTSPRSDGSLAAAPGSKCSHSLCMRASMGAPQTLPPVTCERPSRRRRWLGGDEEAMRRR